MPTKQPGKAKAPKWPASLKRGGVMTISAPPMAKPVKTARAVFADSGHVQVTDAKGRRIEELERPWILLWAQFCLSQGHDPTKFKIETETGKSHKVIKHGDELTWKIGG